MSTAFEITVEDVENVFEQAGKPISSAQAEKIFDEVIAPEDGRIEKAALWGNDMETQTSYAYQEIKTILIEAKLLPKPNAKKVCQRG